MYAERKYTMANEKQPKQGGISVESEHLFPIIKKWLYSEKEIFLRELVSNAVDAVTKLRRLSSLGEYGEEEGAKYRVDVSFCKADRTVTVSDNGIGMTEDELDRYICKVALSGAMEFMQKYEGKTEGAGSGIIGHFGLGFYSAFMVADEVEVVTRSYTGAPAVRWVGSESGEYSLYDEGVERSRGTSVVLHLNDEGMEYLSEYKLREILSKYCAFMPVEIYLTDEEKENGPKKDGETEAEPMPVNDTAPLWQKNQSECTDKEYSEFYTKVFSDYREPLFHLHLNADYPLNFRGILFFPRLKENFENLEGRIKLYYNQVFVADNIREVIPEYLLMLRGVLDCPELPLNVSRSYLQNSAYVSKISSYIVKKVADKLCSMFKLERERYEELWGDLKTFVEYAAICDRKFFDRVRTALLLPLVSGGHMTLDEYLEAAKEKHENTVYYATDPELQAQYIAMYEAKGIRVVRFDGALDTRFAAMLEENTEGGKLRFLRVDADLSAVSEGVDEENAALVELLTKAAGDASKLTVKPRRLSPEDAPAVLTVTEESRRMEDMMRMYAPDGVSAFAPESTLLVNTASPIVSRLADGSYGERTEQVARQLFLLAALANRKLSAEELRELLSGSFDLLGTL